MASASALPPQPAMNSPILQDDPPDENIFSLIWRTYMAALDRMFRNAQFGPLINAANDAAAATAGVPVNGFYRNGSVVMIRVS